MVLNNNNNNTKWAVQECTCCGRFLGCRQDQMVEACSKDEHSKLPHFDSQTGIWYGLIAPPVLNVENPSSHRGGKMAGRQQSQGSPQSPSSKSGSGEPGTQCALVYVSEETLACLGLTESVLLSLDEKVVARTVLSSNIAPFQLLLMPKFLTQNNSDSIFGSAVEFQQLVKIKRVKYDSICDAPTVHLIPATGSSSELGLGGGGGGGKTSENGTESSKKEALEQLILSAKNCLSANFFHQNQQFQFASSFQANVRVPLLSGELFSDQDDKSNIFTNGFSTAGTPHRLGEKMAQLSISPSQNNNSKSELVYCDRRVYRLSRERDARVVLRDGTMLDPDLPAETFRALCGPVLFEKLIDFFRAQIVSSGDLIRMGFRPPRGLLLHGSPGTGKSALCAYLADLADTNVVLITADRVFTRFYGDCESTLRSLFDTAIRNAPSTIIIDDIDVFCSKGEAERKLVACLCSLLDMVHRLPASVRLFVIAATSKLEGVDASLRRYGRLDHEFELLPPDSVSRHAMIAQLLARADHTLSRADFDALSEMTTSFVAADIRALCTEAALFCSMRYRSQENDEKEAEVSRQKMSFADFTRVFPRVRPSARRDICVEVPRVSWQDIGGMDDVKNRLRQCVEWPMRHASALTRLGLRPPKGALLYGPPGCSKTLIARALATESGLAFLSIKGPELFNKWLGESERAVRQLFRRARQAAPSIVFFDEVDAIAPARSGGPSSSSQQASSASERVVAQLLTELDGIQDLDRVFVLAATNRPDVLDTAVIRPGRLDRLIYVPLPDDATRRQILALQFVRTPFKSLHSVSLDETIANLASQTDGFTGAELVSLVQEAAFNALDRSSFTAVDVTEADFEFALSIVKPRTDMRLLEAYEAFSLVH